MFTGLVAYVAEVSWIDRCTLALTLQQGALIGDSVSVNGVCLTVQTLHGSRATFCLSETTLKVTAFEMLPSHSPTHTTQQVNVEHALRMGDPLGGHVVSGHVDATGTVEHVDEDHVITLSVPDASCMVPKGSICIDGISLTIAGLQRCAEGVARIRVAIVPHTWHATTIHTWRPGTTVNVEYDHGSLPQTDGDYMRRALQLSQRAKGYVLPNPWVGCVVVADDGRIVAEGWHREFGGAHAEVDALSRVDTHVTGLTVYVTLEPCSHHGKTPPCTDALLKAACGGDGGGARRRVKRVVVGVVDPRGGDGIGVLTRAGVDVTVGVLEAEICRDLEPYLFAQAHDRPFVTGKLALYANGVFASHDANRLMISDECCTRDAHALRSECDAILVGAATWILDRPQLTVRHGAKPCPRWRRFVLCDDRHAVPEQLADLADTIFVRLAHGNTASDHHEVHDPHQWVCEDVADLLRRMRVDAGVVHLLVEGGERTLELFDAHVDRLIMYVNPDLSGGTGGRQFRGRLRKRCVRAAQSCGDSAVRLELVDS